MASVVAGDDHRLAYALASTQRSLDLAQFDAEAADLDLSVVATQKLQHAIGTLARQITRAIHALPR
ncbi:hypothetical protein A6R71_15695 [Xanthomonas translucens pv. arrhenatheri]|nr:hypothetical protein A6R71_15695 [Xanthomonas translucens pv. arrhenatheri]